MSEFADIGDSDRDRSFSSASNLTNTSSKAVLSALRALQEKIRRLEAERAQALEETAQIRHQMKTLEIESNHAKQKENLTMQKSLQDARLAYDRLLTEKTELEVRLSNLENKNREASGVVEDQQRRTRALETDKHSAMLRVKDLEAAHSQLEAQLQGAQLKEKGMFLYFFI